MSKSDKLLIAAAVVVGTLDVSYLAFCGWLLVRGFYCG